MLLGMPRDRAPAGGPPRDGFFATALGRRLRRAAVTVAGFGVLAAGGAMLIGPGPGWVAVAAGLAILSTEYEWARRALRKAQVQVRKLADAATANPLVVAGNYVLAAALLAAAVLSRVYEGTPLRSWPLAIGLAFGGVFVAAATSYELVRQRRLRRGEPVDPLVVEPPPAEDGDSAGPAHDGDSAGRAHGARSAEGADAYGGMDDARRR